VTVKLTLRPKGIRIVKLNRGSQNC